MREREGRIIRKKAENGEQERYGQRCMGGWKTGREWGMEGRKESSERVGMGRRGRKGGVKTQDG